MSGKQPNDRDIPQESAFIALKALQGLNVGAGQGQVLLADIFNYVSGGTDRDQRVATAMKTNLNVRRQLQQVLQQQRLSVAPAEALAQDTSELPMRTGKGFRILFRRSRADLDQVYLVLEVEPNLEINEGEDVLIIAEGELAVARLQFYSISNGRSQTILRTGDEKLDLIKNSNNPLSLLEL